MGLLDYAKFPPGRIVATPGVMKKVARTDLSLALARHVRGDWGDVCEADQSYNNMALKTDGRLLSSYRSNNGTKFWIITEADRSATTFLLPEEY